MAAHVSEHSVDTPGVSQQAYPLNDLELLSIDTIDRSPVLAPPTSTPNIPDHQGGNDVRVTDLATAFEAFPTDNEIENFYTFSSESEDRFQDSPQEEPRGELYAAIRGHSSKVCLLQAGTNEYTMRSREDAVSPIPEGSFVQAAVVHPGSDRLDWIELPMDGAVVNYGELETATRESLADILYSFRPEDDIIVMRILPAGAAA